MSFDAPVFFVFFLLVFSICRFLPRYSGAVLLCGSILFYSFAGLLDLAVVLFVVVSNYFLSFSVVKNKKWLYIVILINLVILSFFKYRYFFFPELSADVTDFYHGDILIPLGISFYIFQAVAYQADLAAGRTNHIPSLWHFSLFILLFSQVIAGPIVRANMLEPQAAKLFEGGINGRRIWYIGIGLCLLGLLKKVGLADSLAPYVDAIFTQGPGDVFTAWIGSILFAFQIYLDFSGYSDIAVGASYLLGIRLPLNFRQPYLAKDPREFWQRWHITLSHWIRDYIYIPFGGSRKGGRSRQMIVLLLTMGLAGLWHGANWTFIVWGLFWGLYLGVWRWIEPYASRLGLLQWFSHIFIVLLLWVFFRAASLDDAFSFIGAMLGMPKGEYQIATSMTDAMLLLIGVALLMLSQFAEAKLTNFNWIVKYRRFDKPLLWGILTGLILWLVIYPKTLSNPFIYFRF